MRIPAHGVHCLRLARLFAVLLASLLPAAANAEILISKNIAYGPDQAQTFDVYAPPGAKGAPVLMMVHGGAWRFGDKEARRVVDNKQARWLPRGFVFISVNYRMLPATGPLDQARDIALALATAQDKAEQWGADRHSFILIGHSAGAHLIALLAARPELAREQGATPWLGTILLDSAALDVPAIMSARHLPLYDRAFGSNPADWASLSPFHQLRQAGAPVLAVCSARRDSACPQAESFVAKARRLGTRGEVLRLDKTHGEINAQLGADPEYTAAVERFIGQLSPRLAEQLR